jgi:ribosomal protein L16 Arg81 hydroxylase
MSFFDFEKLIGDVGSEEFFAEHWEKAPLHVVRPRTVAAYDQIFTLDDLESVLLCEETDAAARRCRGDSDSRTHTLLLQHGAPVAGPFHCAYLAGASIVTNRVDLAAPRLAQLCIDLRRELAYVFAVSYLTPPGGAQAVPAHSDDQDVFIVQIAGRKSWRVWPPLVALPYPDEMAGKRGGIPLRREDLAAVPLLQVELQPGDLLYVPRGFVHEASSVGEAPSLHVTLTVPSHDFTHGRLLSRAIESALRGDVRARHAVSLRRLGQAAAAEGSGEGDADDAAAHTVALRAMLASAVERVFADGADASSRMLGAMGGALARPRAAQRAAARRASEGGAGEGASGAAWRHPECVGGGAQLRLMRGMRIELGSTAHDASGGATVPMIVRRGESSLRMRVGAGDVPLISAVAAMDGPFSAAELPGGDAFAKMCIAHMLLEKGILERLGGSVVSQC